MSAAKMAEVLNPSKTPQSEPVPGKKMEKNNAGGFSFVLDDWGRLDRWLILGSERTYYVGERKMTLDNAQCVMRCVAEDGAKTVERVVAVSDAGRAPKNSPAIFALAIAAEVGDQDTKTLAYKALTKVCRTGTHLFEWVAAKKTLGGGFGSGCRRAISRWYTEKDADDLAYQLIKYRSRSNWSHRDVLRMCRPSNAPASHSASLRWAVKGMEGLGDRTVESTKNKDLPVRKYEAVGELPYKIQAFEEMQRLGQEKADVKAVIALLERSGLPWEAIPTEYLKEAKVWEALMPTLPLHATVRNLGRMTANGLIKPLSETSRKVVERLKDQAYILKSRMHPMALLIALKTYSQGHGEKGSLSWSPDSNIVDALNDAFHLAFGNVPVTGKRWLLALDVSGSMNIGTCAGSPITPREASAAMALVTAAVEPQTYIFGFGTQFMELKGITGKSRLKDAIQVVSNLSFTGTDCAKPMLWARENKIDADCFSVYTDNETWAGAVHPFQALKDYRQARGINAKSITVGMTSTEFTISDPSDPGMLDCVGFDTTTPAAMAAFVMG
jgi:60 kDa SS-A/Ro ribonucleoprotein